ncbi:MAG: hypothetical protein LBT20_02215 [Clostridiales bacterium]|jgi:flagellar biogenesis protein FliO|nr:hypothetical protein [Clostridiales bacterium]
MTSIIGFIQTLFASVLSAINLDDLGKAGEIFGKGMLAIFIVVALIVAATYLLKYFSERAQKKTDAKKDAETTETSDAE